LLLLSGWGAAAQAQQDSSASRLHVGIAGGYALNQLSTSTGYRAFTAYGNGDGYTLGVPVRYVFTDWFALQVEPSVIQKSYSWRRTEYFAEATVPYRETANTYVQAPLMAHFSFGGRVLRGFFNPGAFVGYWAGSHVKGVNFDSSDKPYPYDEAFAFDARRDNRLEYGLTLGAGIEYAFARRLTAALECRYYYGASDLQKDYMKQQVPRYNDTWVVQACLLFNLPTLH
jgi:opacity protein-like surface antigen